MTFCLGITVDQGLVGIADTRVVAGNECLVARKTATYQGPGFLVLRDDTPVCARCATRFCSTSRRHLRAPRRAATAFRRWWISTPGRCAAWPTTIARRSKPPSSTFNFHALIGGQMAADSTHRLFLVYPEGNWVEVGPDTPYQIIGAIGFGKPILERSLTRADSMLYAFKVGILAFDATRLCAADVDFPMDVLLYAKGSYQMIEHRYERDDLRQISNWWQDRMRRSVQELPSEWIDSAFSKLTGQGAAF